MKDFSAADQAMRDLESEARYRAAFEAWQLTTTPETKELLEQTMDELKPLITDWPAFIADFPELR